MPGADIPDSPRPIGPAEAHAIIDRRLDALGHPPDYLDATARAVLTAQAAGSPGRLRASLAAVLFLASTEDAPAIDAGLVQRALHASQPDSPPPALPRQRRHRPPVVPLAIGISATVMLLGLLTLTPHRHSAVHSERPAPTSTSPAPLPAPLADHAASPPDAAASLTRQPTREASLDLVPPAPPPAPASAAAAASASAPAPAPASSAAADGLAPLPPAVAIGAPSLAPAPAAGPATPAAAVPSGTADPVQPPPRAVTQIPLPPPAASAQPAATPAPPSAEVANSVLLLYPARSPAALARLRPLAIALQHAGFTTIRARPTRVIPTRRAISFFYGEDAARAQLIANLLANSGWPHLDGNSLQPSLVLVPAGLPPRSPGELEVQLP